MKRPAWWLCLFLPLAAPAAEGEFARQWPLTLSRDSAGAYGVVLDEAVYRQLQTPDLRDFDVRNRDGAAVPSALFAPEQPLAESARRVDLPWFVLPSTPAGSAVTGWELVGQVDADGRLRGVSARVTGTAVEALPKNVLLVDLSQVREPIVALELQWKPLEALDLGYRVEASNDLSRWQTLATRGRLVDLQREGRRLLHRRIELNGLLPHYQQARYLRLTPDRGDQAVEISAIGAELVAPAVPAEPRWLDVRGRRVDEDGKAYFEFVVDGRFPVQQADVAMAGNHAVEWRLESRDDADADWRLRAGPWMAYQVDEGGHSSQSRPRVLDTVHRDRYWRLGADTAVTGEPVLRLGYRPEVVVFLAQGPGPYALAAGSARARRADSPVPQLVAALREERGADWQPSPAYLGESRVLAGEAALQPVRDWKTGVLWSVLVLGALVVAGFAWTLLRRSVTPKPEAVDAGVGAGTNAEEPRGP